MWPPKKNVPFTVYAPIYDADGDLVPGATGLSSVLIQDGNPPATGPVPVDEGEGIYSVALTAAQMNFDAVVVIIKTTTAGAKNTVVTLYTVSKQMDDLATPADILATPANKLATGVGGVVTVGTNQDKAGYSLTAAQEDAIVNKVFDEPTAEVRAAGSYGQLLKDNLDAKVSTRSTLTSAQVWDEAEGALVTVRPTTMRGWMQWIARRLFNKVTAPATAETVFRDDDITALATMTRSDDGTTQTKGKA